MPELVVFRMEAPIAAFGDLAVGERRGSERRPSHSAVAGLLASALGLGRDTSGREDLAARFFLAVRTDSIGTPLADFHTAQTPPQRRGRTYATRRAELAVKDDLGTIVSRRDYLTDVAFTVLIWPKADLSPAAPGIAAALNRPAFTPFAGRRSCPVGAPFCAMALASDTILDAFAAYDRLLHARLPPVNLSPPETIDIAFDSAMPGEATVGLAATRTGKRRDMPLTREPWQFELRDETVARPAATATTGAAT